MYTRYLEKHVRPFIGRLKASGVNGEAGQVPPGLPSVPHSGLHTVPLGSLL
jgi:hypothetical protein